MNQFNISIKDFQLIENANLSFIPGLNIIIGQSNNGKTAIFRAAKASIYNELGTASIRHGCNAYAVGIQDDDHTIIFQKSLKETTYKIDGMTYQKPGRTQLPEVANALNIKELNLNGINEELNFWDQMEKPFLLDRSETDLFRFIVDSGKDNNIMKALKDLTSDRQEISRRILQLQGQIEMTDSKILEYAETLKDSEVQLGIIEKITTIGPAIQRVKQVRSLIEEYNKKEESKKYYQNQFDSVSSKIDTLSNQLELIDTKFKKLKLIEDIIKRHDSASDTIHVQSERLKVLNNININSTLELFEKYNKIKNIINDIESKNNQISQYKNIKFIKLPDKLEEETTRVSVVMNLINNISNRQTDISNYQAIVDNKMQELDAVKKEIEEIGVCPTCGKPLHS